jgi:acetolactate synthase regulatory subunit
MQRVDFSTEDPVQHLLRALDELRRMGFALTALSVAADEAGADIRIAFACPDPALAENYRARLARMCGVRAVRAELAAPAAAC